MRITNLPVCSHSLNSQQSRELCRILRHNHVPWLELHGRATNRSLALNGPARMAAISIAVSPSDIQKKSRRLSLAGSGSPLASLSFGKLQNRPLSDST